MIKWTKKDVIDKFSEAIQGSEKKLDSTALLARIKEQAAKARGEKPEV